MTKSHGNDSALAIKMYQFASVVSAGIINRKFQLKEIIHYNLRHPS